MYMYINRQKCKKYYYKNFIIKSTVMYVIKILLRYDV